MLFRSQHLMAERDIEREILTNGEMYKDVLLKMWSMKNKDEKQSLISKFIDTAELIKKMMEHLKLLISILEVAL